jgi:hypothetical protein
LPVVLWEKTMGNLFEAMATGANRTVVGLCYHWSDPSEMALSMSNIDPERSLFISDEYYSWANFEHGGSLYELRVAFTRPLTLLEQMEDFETLFPEDGSGLYNELVKKGDFDSVVYTPHPYGRGIRQAVLLEPRKQILAVKEIEDYSPELIEAYRERESRYWRSIMNQS